MSATTAQNAIAVVGIDIGKNSFRIVGLDDRGVIVLRQKWSRSQIDARFCQYASSKSGTQSFRPRCPMPAKYVRPYSKGQKNDFRDAEAAQRPTKRFVTTKSADQLDLQALHRVRERLVSKHTGIINQIRAFLLERG